MEEEKKPYNGKNQRQERPGRSQGEQQSEPKTKRAGRRNSRDFGRPEGEREERAPGRERRPRGERNRRKTYDRASRGERRADASSAENETKERERRGSPKGPRRQNKRNVKERGERWEDGRRNRRFQDERPEEERQRRARRGEISEEQNIAGRRSENTELSRLSEVETGGFELKAVHHEEVQLTENGLSALTLHAEALELSPEGENKESLAAVSEAKRGQREAERQGESPSIPRNLRSAARTEKKAASREMGTARRDKQEERLPAPRAEKKRKSWDKLDTDEMKVENDRLDEEIQAEIEALGQFSL